MEKNLTANTCTRTLRVNSERIAHLDTFMKQLIESGAHPTGSVRVLYDGVEIFSGAYGVSAPGGQPLTMDAIYPMASVTKVVTATLLAILQEEGVLDFCDKVKKYYPDFTGGKKDEIEIWQLMCHSSGMSDETMQRYIREFIKENLGIELAEDSSFDDYSAAVLKTREILGLPKTEDPAAIDETVFLLKLKAPLACDPHTAFNYCSMAYTMLGRLIEKLSGECIENYAARKLFGPLGMSDSHFILPESKWPRVVKRDSSLCFADWLNSDFVLTSTDGGGGLKSTLHDLTQLGQMYLQEGALGGAQILSPASVKLLTSNQNSRLPDSFWFGRILGSAWGLGWHVRCGKRDDLGLLRSDRTFDHGGAGGARLVIDPDSGLVFSMYMVDSEPFDAYPNHSRVANIIYSSLVK